MTDVLAPLFGLAVLGANVVVCAVVAVIETAGVPALIWLIHGLLRSVLDSKSTRPIL